MPCLSQGYKKTIALILGVCSQRPCCEAACGEAHVSKQADILRPINSHVTSLKVSLSLGKLSNETARPG